jgi:hypothetical protein
VIEVLKDCLMTVREIEAAYLSGKRLQTVMTSEQIALCNFDVFKK